MAGALGVIVAKTPVHSVISLVVNILALAALYLALHAEFLALIQVIVYAGAIMILFLFVIALLTARKDPIERTEGKLEGQRELGLVTAVGGAVLMIAVAAVGGTRPDAGQRSASLRFRVGGRLRAGAAYDAHFLV